jgi:hypothetical protein
LLHRAPLRAPFHTAPGPWLGARCNCPFADAYLPLCDAAGNAALFSPCFAGCTVKLSDTRYGNCTCSLGAQGATVGGGGVLDSATLPTGVCKQACSSGKLVSFMILLGLTMVSSGGLWCGVASLAPGAMDGVGWGDGRLAGGTATGCRGGRSARAPIVVSLYASDALAATSRRHALMGGGGGRWYCLVFNNTPRPASLLCWVCAGFHVF